jgi:hypothetical protein
MTVLHCQPLIFHDRKIVTVNLVSVFDIAQ